MLNLKQKMRSKTVNLRAFSEFTKNNPAKVQINKQAKKQSNQITQKSYSDKANDNPRFYGVLTHDKKTQEALKYIEFADKCKQNITQSKLTSKSQNNNDQWRRQKLEKNKQKYVNEIPNFQREVSKQRQMVKKQQNFIDSIDDYITQLDSKGNLKEAGAIKEKSEKLNQQKYKDHRQQKSVAWLTQIRNQIEGEKQMNRTLQKSVIEFQKILWNRSEKLDKLEKQLNMALQQKRHNQNESKLINVIDKNTKKFNEPTKNLSHFLNPFFQSGSSRQNSQSDDLSEQKSTGRILTQQSQVKLNKKAIEFKNNNQLKQHEYFDFKRKRKTQLSTQLERMIQKALKVQNSRQKKSNRGIKVMNLPRKSSESDSLKQAQTKIKFFDRFL